MIKQDQFIRTGSQERVIDSYQSEIDRLRSLYCQNIPRYLDGFDTSTGFRLVQESKNAPSLENYCSYTPPEIKIIALAILELLIYLQKQIPCVIHGDIKPEKVLIDRDNLGLVYLKASDLYSLEVTLICLLTETKSANISKLIDEKAAQFPHKSYLPPLNPRFIQCPISIIALLMPKRLNAL